MTVKELQVKAREKMKDNPREALEILECALEMDSSNLYTIPLFGSVLRKIGQPKKFIDFCAECENFIVDNKHVLATLCWCLYDYSVKSFTVTDIDKLELFFQSAERIVLNCVQLNLSECFKNPYVLTVFKVVKILDKLDSENYNRQLEWMRKINSDFLPIKDNVQINENGTKEVFVSLKEQYFNQMSWIFYKQKIKPFNVKNSKIDSDESEFIDFIEAANFITDNCVQKTTNDERLNPYVLTVLKVVKNFNRQSSKNYTKMLEWIKKLNSSILSEEVYNFTDAEGKERELPSPKEQYFQYITKSYEKLFKYSECIVACDAGMESISKFHYKNHIWIRARRYYCACMIADNFEVAIKEYINLAKREKHWFMFHKIAILYLTHNQIDLALLYAAKAFSGNRIDMEKMINLVYDIGILLQAKSMLVQANVFFQACAYYRNFREWTISEELKFMIEENNWDIQKKYSEKQLEDIVKKYLPISSEIEDVKEDIQYGSIQKILNHGDGFISRKYNEPIYFKSKENKNFCICDKVAFEIGKDNRNRPIAFNIKLQRREI